MRHDRRSCRLYFHSYRRELSERVDAILRTTIRACRRLSLAAPSWSPARRRRIGAALARGFHAHGAESAFIVTALSAKRNSLRDESELITGGGTRHRCGDGAATAPVPAQQSRSAAALGRRSRRRCVNSAGCARPTVRGAGRRRRGGRGPNLFRTHVVPRASCAAAGTIKTVGHVRPHSCGFSRVLDVNLMGTYLVCREAMRRCAHAARPAIRHDFFARRHPRHQHRLPGPFSMWPEAGMDGIVGGLDRRRPLRNPRQLHFAGTRRYADRALNSAGCAVRQAGADRWRDRKRCWTRAHGRPVGQQYRGLFAMTDRELGDRALLQRWEHLLRRSAPASR